MYKNRGQLFLELFSQSYVIELELSFQNPEFILDCQNPEFKILAVQNLEFRTLEVVNSNSKS